MKNAIQMLEDCSSDMEKARMKADDVLADLENKFEDWDEEIAGDEELNIEALDIIEQERGEIKNAYGNIKRETKHRSEKLHKSHGTIGP